MIELRTVPSHEAPGGCLDLGRRYQALGAYYKALDEAGGVARYAKARSPAQRLNLIASQMAAQEAWSKGLVRNGVMANHFGGGVLGEWPGQPTSKPTAEAQVVPDDIAAFITQQLLFVEDLYEQFDWLEIITTIPMQGPRAFIHERQFTRCDDDGVYSSGSALNEGLDPSYTECPTDCGTANRICVTIGSETIEAECRRVGADYCWPAQWHLSSQYKMNLDAMLNEGMSIALKRDIQAAGLAALVASAGGSATFSRTPPVGSYFETANPLEYQRTYWETIRDLDMDIVRAVDGRRGANILAGDPNSIQYLQELVPLDINHNLNAPRDGITMGSATEYENFQGTMRGGRYNTFLFPTMPEDTLLVMVRDDREPTFVFAPWIPFTDIGPLTLPLEAQTQMGMITLYGQTVIRPGRIQALLLAA